jgi:hypothetical protein
VQQVILRFRTSASFILWNLKFVWLNFHQNNYKVRLFIKFDKFSFFILLLQGEQKGSIGITLDAQWHEPLTNSSEDANAAERMQLFAAGW